MKFLLSLAVVLFTAGLFVSDGHADNAKGTCNAIVATELGTAQECSRMSCEPGSAQCMDITNTFVEFVATEGCVEAFQNGELNGLPGNASIQPSGPDAGAVKNVNEVICNAIASCGLCPSALALGICPTLCLD
jgi:hypothetical protein